MSTLRIGQALVVAIDGPSGSGKSSVARAVARELRLAYQDTGAMYRALTWQCLADGVDFDDAAAVEHVAATFEFAQSTGPDETWVRIGERDVTAAIREPRISESVSRVSTNLGARNELIRRQRQEIADAAFRMVVEGRDITTVVATDAQVRILLTASEAVRMARRGVQLSDGGKGQSREQLTQQVLQRDAKDSTVVNFQRAADGVVTLDSTDLDLDQTVDAVLEVVYANVGGGGNE